MRPGDIYSRDKGIIKFKEKIKMEIQYIKSRKVLCTILC